MPPTDVDDELGRLRRRVDELEARLPGSNKTTKAERKAMHRHIEELDEAMKKKREAIPIPPRKVNTFHVGEFVEQNLVQPELTRGKIAYIACRLALPKFKECDRKKCEHKSKSYVWVMWPNKTMIVYHFSKLRLLTEEDMKPRIGKELSGRVGPWTYDAATKIWKKDGDSKAYTAQEFADYLYFESNPYAKEDGERFVKYIKNATIPSHPQPDVHDEDGSVDIDVDI